MRRVRRTILQIDMCERLEWSRSGRGTLMPNHSGVLEDLGVGGVVIRRRSFLTFRHLLERLSRV
jgi:hypothetical protein